MPKNSQFDPPALPPKRQRNSSSNASLNVAVTPPVSPKISNDHCFAQEKNEEKEEKRNSSNFTSNEDKQTNNSIKNETTKEPDTVVVLRKKPTEKNEKTMNLMEELEVNDYLVFKRDGDGPLTLVGGRAEALIIHATRAQKVLEGKLQ